MRRCYLVTGELIEEAEEIGGGFEVLDPGPHPFFVVTPDLDPSRNAEFGARVREARTAKCLSHRALAKTLGVHVERIDAWERGAWTPSLKIIDEIAAALEVPSGWLVFGDQGEGSHERG